MVENLLVLMTLASGTHILHGALCLQRRWALSGEGVAPKVCQHAPTALEDIIKSV